MQSYGRNYILWIKFETFYLFDLKVSKSEQIDSKTSECGF